jgi:hypothetical protein
MPSEMSTAIARAYVQNYIPAIRLGELHYLLYYLEIVLAELAYHLLVVFFCPAVIRSGDLLFEHRNDI